MNSYVFNEEIKRLMKLKIPQDYAVLAVSAKLDDKTIFNSQVAKMKQENDAIELYMKEKGFHLSTDIIEDDNTNNINENQKD